MKYIIDRLREPSTRNGIALALTIAAQLQPQYAAILLPLAGTIAVHAAVTPDPKR